MGYVCKAWGALGYQHLGICLCCLHTSADTLLRLWRQDQGEEQVQASRLRSLVI